MDRYDNLEKDISQPAVDGVAVTPGAMALTDVTRCLFVGVGGDVQVTFMGIDGMAGNTVVHKNVQSGAILPIRVTHVLATLTTATDIVAWY